MANETTYLHSQFRIYYSNIAGNVLANLTDSVAGDISMSLGGIVTTERRNKSGTGRVGMRAFGESADQASVSFPSWLGTELEKVMDNLQGRLWVERLDAARVFVMPCFVAQDSLNAPVPGGQQLQLQFQLAVFAHSATDTEQGYVEAARETSTGNDKTLASSEVAYIRTATGIKRATTSAAYDVGTNEIHMHGTPQSGEAEG